MKSSPPPDRRADAVRSTDSLVAVVLLVAAVVGGALRLHHIGQESAWLDEAFSIEIARTSIANILHQTALDVHPPLYYLALKAWLPLAGTTEGPARALSTLFSVLTALAAFGITARLVDIRTGLATAMVLALSRFQVEYAQEARMYALLALLATLSMHTFVEWAERPTRSALLGYIAVTSLMTYTHVYSVFTIAGQGLTLLALLRVNRDRAMRLMGPWFVALAVIFLLFVPWAGILMAQLRRVQQVFWIEPPRWYSLFHPAYAYSGNSIPLTCLFVPLAAVGYWRLTRRHAPAGGPEFLAGRPLLVIIPWLVAPIALPLAVSLVSSPIFLPKYTIAASVPFSMLVARGFVSIPSRVGRLVVALGVVASTALSFQTYFGTVRKDAWRDATAIVGLYAEPGDRVLFYRWFNQYAFDFYNKRTGIDEVGLPIDTIAPTSDEITRAVASSTGGASRLWFMTLLNEPARPSIVDELSKTYVLKEHAQAPHVEVYLFERAR